MRSLLHERLGRAGYWEDPKYGAEWRIYNAHAPVPIEDKLFRSIDIAQDPDTAIELLELLSKENMRENRIQNSATQRLRQSHRQAD